MTIPSRPLKDSEKAMLIDDVFHFDITQYVDIRIYHDKYNPKQPDNQAWTVPPLMFNPDGRPIVSIYFPADTYRDDFSQIGMGNTNDIRAAGLFVHEMTHAAQSNMDKYRFNGSNDYNYSEIFTGTPFDELGMEEQAEFNEDHYLATKWNISDIDRIKGLDNKDGDVGEHTPQDYINAMPATSPFQASLASTVNKNINSYRIYHGVMDGGDLPPVYGPEAG